MTIDHVNPEAPWPDLERLRAADRGEGLRPRRAPAALPGARRGARHAGSTRSCSRTSVVPPTRSAMHATTAWAPGEPGDVPFLVRRDALPLELGADELGEDGARAPVRGARGGASPCLRRRRPAAPRGVRRRGDLRRDAEHPVHERLLLPLRLLRVLEGEAGREPARAGLPRPARGDRAPRAGGVGARRHRGVPPGRHPSGVHGRLLRRRRAGDQGRGARACTCTRSPRSRSGRAPRRSGSGSQEYLARLRDLGLGSLPGTAAEILDDEVRAVICPDKVTTDQWLEVHDAAHRVGLRSNVTIMFGHVEAAAQLGASPDPRARAAAAHRRVHRVRAAAVRADGGADLPQGPCPARADVRRGAARARRRATRAASVDHERAGVVGQAGAGRRAPGARGRA